MTDLMQYLRRVARGGDGAELSDGQLLDCFLVRHDDSAFAALMQRHGPMVWCVCRRLLASQHDCEDAFQATFLVLARKAASIQPREHVGNWLYGVAYRTALRAKMLNAKRLQKEKEAAKSVEASDADAADWLELLPYLDRELNRLPDKYRLPIVLCDLQGRSRKEVACRLAIPEGTLSSRLATGRKRLAERMRQHGLFLAGGALAGLLAQQAASNAAPAGLMVATIRAAMLMESGRVLAGVVSTTVAFLMESTVKSMLLNKLRSIALLLLAVAILTTGAGLPIYRIWAKAPAESMQEAADDEKTIDKNSPKEKKDGERRDIRGSGKIVTKEIKAADFTTVAVGSVFSATITQGDAFRVTITADDNLFPYIKAEKKDSEFRVSLDGKDKSFHNTTLKATITMPRISGLKVSGASQTAIKGFKNLKSFRAEISGASKLKGDIEANEVRLQVHGASGMKLSGSAKSAVLILDGASNLQLSEFRIDRADVRISGASHASLFVEDKLQYQLSGASHLEHRGKAEGKGKRSGVSSVSHK